MDFSTWDAAWTQAEPIAAAATGGGATDGPLAGLRILDLSRLLPGPMAARQLADLGARVLKVEPPGAVGDDAALLGAAGADGVSYFYRVVNHGKRRMRLDLKDAADRARFLDLAGRSHAVIEGFRPGTIDRLGVGWPVLQACNPRLVLASINGYGSAGPRAMEAGHDIGYLAEAGVLDQSRAPDGRPTLCHLQIADLLGGAMSAALATLAGVTGALTGGAGGWFEVSMTDAVRQHLVIAGTEALDAALHGRPEPAPASALLNGGAACYNLYACADGAWLAVGALELRFWQALCEAVGRPDWRDRHWSRGEPPGSAQARATIGEMAAWLATRDRAHWLAALDGHDVCTVPVRGLREAMFGTGPVDEAAGLAALVRPVFRRIG